MRLPASKSLKHVVLPCLLAFLSIMPLGSVVLVPARGFAALDMTGAVQVKDPFGACHADSYGIMADLGIKNNRKDISWSEIEPINDAWYWTNWDNRMAGLKACNMTALPILDYSNWAVQEGGMHGKVGNYITTEHDLEEWLEYANACVERYYENDSHYTRYWELWNEPNLGDIGSNSGFWTGTDAEYFALQKATAANLSARWPGLQLVSAGISGHDPKYLDAMFASGAMENVDVLAFHPYSGSNYENLDSKIADVKAVASKWGFTGPIWITEVGMSTQFDPEAPGYEARYQATLELQATLVPKVYCLALANGIEYVTWYCLGDFADWKWGEANFGLVFDDSNTYKPAPYASDIYKPSGYAYKAIAHQLNWSTFVPNGVSLANPGLPSAPRLRSFYFLKGNGDVVFICWNANGEIATNIQFSMPADGVDVYSGPSYKPGLATNYDVATTADGITVSAAIGFSPTIFVIDMKPGAPATSIVIETTFNFYDASLLVIVPSLLATCIIAFVARYTPLKKYNRKLTKR
ncbi:MAG: hypothetical protein GYA24_06360 [Candidatus Lokiarchaeota archaeon]|nr:hypothetical protein [Candidatus Lokiarchaeota archaeon]